MEDPTYAVFNKEDRIIYKEILQEEECKELNDYLMLMIQNHLSSK